MSHTVFVSVFNGGLALSALLLVLKLLNSRFTYHDSPSRLSWAAVPLPFLLAIAILNAPYVRAVLFWHP
jgi:hypothetical protein